ncbi:zinc dependent phospholipase C family protein [Pedobacter sp.]|jgi:hypothetical protein|uniref:zinc dependent phospholipase C family protein n=1 Tax=Pedobacter sp. TaxID=1411316 RepID=UPI002B59340D|nr:zinc dependent phospholipase C family protein [Pedobacter sp.]HWW42719.1 zinc dependent phospholipase C family protein [Pedobacter sp.]
MKQVFIYVTLAGILLVFGSWGFYAHRQINRLAVFTLPKGISRFYKSNISYLSDHAVDPDKRRYADTAEAPRHYLDVEAYDNCIDSIPRKWDLALKKYSRKMLQENGILPWHIQRSYLKLVNAFKQKDSVKILICSAQLGHYIADAHVPLHTTNNHNGQLTNQVGIHAFWESRLPELYADRYNYRVGKAFYVAQPLQEAWNMVSHTHSLVDSVLKLEASLSLSFPHYRKYSFSKRKGLLTRQYSEDYSKAYHEAMNHMVERQMRSAIHYIGSFWYSAWIDAGQPDMEQLKRIDLPFEERQKETLENLKYEKGSIIGREY